MSFVAAAMAVSDCSKAQPEFSKDVLNDTQQQLTALMPLYASEPQLLSTIHQLKEWLRHDDVMQFSTHLQ